MSDIVISGRYLLQDKIGAGGMGVVYKATDRLTGRTVALKQVTVETEQLQFMTRPTTEFAKDLRLALAHEFQTLASLRHPHIISVLDYGFDAQKRPYFTMPYLANARNILETGEGKPTTTRVELLQQMLQALAYLHRRGVLHRDLKPDNILVSDESVRVLDFGLAATKQKDTHFSSAGTIAYLAPEVWDGVVYSKASDLFAVGIVAYELLVGEHPFAPIDIGFINRLLFDSPDLSPLPSELATVVGRLLARDPTERYERAEDVIVALSRAMGVPTLSETAAIRESYLQAAEFVGRKDELRQLTQALTDVTTGQGSAWLIGGESGVGKSRLLNELRVQALVDGFLVLYGQGVQDGRLSFQMWREPLRRLILMANIDDLTASVLRILVPDIHTLLGRKIPAAPALDSQAAQQRLLNTVTDLFRQQRRPVLLILEDLQWGGESMVILKHLSRLVSELPLLVLGSYRDDEAPNLPTMMPDMHTMRLARLSGGEIGILSKAILGEVGEQSDVLAFLQRETEGNAFFLVEVVRALAEKAGELRQIGQVALPETMFPQGIQTIVQRRLAKVPVEAHILLRVAAVAGRLLDFRLLDRLATQLTVGMDLETWLGVCSQAAVIEAYQDGWQFAHDKLREGLLAQLSTEQRRQYHQMVAQTIEQLYPDQPDQAAALTYHWYRADNIVKEQAYAEIAGQYALQEFANEEALRYFSRALTITNETDLEKRYALLLMREQIYDLQGQREAQQQDLHRLEALAQQLGHVEQQIEVALREANYALVTSQYATAINTAQTVVSLAEAVPGKGLEEAGYLVWGEALMRQGNYEAARKQLQTVLERTMSEQTRGDSLRILGLLLVDTSQYEEAITSYSQALEHYQRLNDFGQVSMILNNLANVFHAQGDYKQAVTYLQQALQNYKKIGDQQRVSMTLNNLGTLQMDQGNYEEAQRYNESVLEISRKIDSSLGQCFALLNLGLLLHYRGEDEPSQQYSRQALTIAQQMSSLRLQGFAWTNLGHALAGLHKSSEAKDAYQQSLSLWQQLKYPSSALDARAGIARVTNAEGNPNAAMVQVDEILLHINRDKDLTGTENPLRIYLTCYHVLNTLPQRKRAKEILSTAYNLLKLRADQIADEDIRHNFMHQIAANREIMQLYQQERINASSSKQLEHEQHLQGETLFRYMIDVSRRMAEIRNLPPLLTYVIDETLQLVGAERGYIVFLQPDGSLSVKIQRDRRGHNLEGGVDEISQSILDEVIKSGQSLVVSDALTDSRFAQSVSVAYLRLRSVMCVPLITQNRVIGALYVENRAVRDKFRQQDVGPLELMANQAAVSIDNATLNDDLEKSNKALATANEDLRQLDEVKNHFIMLVSHELRTPLTPVKGYADLINMMLEQVTDVIDDKLITTGQKLEQAVQRIQGTVDEVVLTSRILAKQLDLIPEYSTLEPTIRGILEKIHHIIEQRQLDIHVENIESLPVLLIDERYIQVALENVISNAIKYTPDGQQIRIVGQRRDDGILIMVQDCGIGIPLNEQEKVFDLFYILGDISHHSTSKYDFGGRGLGLGLPIARGIVNAHQGRIWLESPGQNKKTLPGTTCYILLPASRIVFAS